jgi:dGTPase
MNKLEWNNCLSAFRRKKKGMGAPASELRSPFERDYDRVLFSAPVRRLADKT